MKSKYEIIKKICPICEIEFETQKGHKREKTTCSRACSNRYFQHGENNPNFDKEKYQKRWEKVSKKLTKGIDNTNEEEIKNLYSELGNMEKVSEKLGVSIQTVRNNINRDIINLLKISIKEKNNLDRKCLNCNNQISIDRKGSYCCTKCSSLYTHKIKYEKYIEDWKNGLVDGGKGIEGGHNGVSGHIRRYLFDKYESKCALCGWDKVNPFTNTQPLEIEHIDGDSLNNKENNLILLCPNCHSLTPGHSTSKGNGRRYYRQKYRDEKGLDIKE